MSTPTQKTLVFCTAWSPDAAGQTAGWEQRYRRWLDAIQASKLEYELILMVDDASISLPAWDDVEIVHEGETPHLGKSAVLYSFAHHLGRHAISDFPGWVRSFGYAAEFAETHGFTKVVHIESDAFLISDQVQRYVNEVDEGWIAFWCPLYERAESGIQIIAGSQMQSYLQVARQDVGVLAKSVIEVTLPFTLIEQRFAGDRYGEPGHGVPRSADYSMQTFPNVWVSNNEYFWWQKASNEIMPQTRAVTAQYSLPVSSFQHVGVNYQVVLSTLSTELAPRTYFEIGSKNGHSLSKFQCDSICVDPNLQLDVGVIGSKPRVFLFQMPSDDFFEQEGIRKYFPKGPDIGFLDGLHLAEFLLRDFMNFEKASHERSIAILHDCLPFNARMAEREIRQGGPDEPPDQRDFWTGDVWKVVVALKHHRPDLNVIYLNCPPTGLVVVTNLDPANRQLDKHYQSIVDGLFTEDLDHYTIDRLWNLYPTLDSAALCQNPSALRQVLGLRP